MASGDGDGDGEDSKSGKYVSIFSSTMFAELLAGGMGGSVGVLVGHPLDTVKVIIQTNPTKLSYISACAQVYNQGFTAFFRGLSVPMASYFLQNSVLFGSYRYALYQLGGDTEPENYSKVCLAAFFSGTVQLSVVVPVENIKIRLQISANVLKKNPGVVHCIRSCLESGGFRALYSGLTATAARDIPSYIPYFFLYEWLLEKFERRKVNPLVSSFVAGSVAGGFTWLAVVPIDVMKSMIQAERAENMRKAAVKLYRSDGLSGFLRGGTFIGIRGFLVCGVTFSVYEFCFSKLKTCLS